MVAPSCALCGVSGDLSDAGDAGETGEGAAADALVRAAERHGADLIVAGGYGHTRSREWAFGGVTRSLLRGCPMCCLLSH